MNPFATAGRGWFASGGVRFALGVPTIFAVPYLVRGVHIDNPWGALATGVVVEVIRGSASVLSLIALFSAGFAGASLFSSGRDALRFLLLALIMAAAGLFLPFAGAAGALLLASKIHLGVRVDGMNDALLGGAALAIFGLLIGRVVRQQPLTILNARGIAPQ